MRVVIEEQTLAASLYFALFILENHTLHLHHIQCLECIITLLCLSLRYLRHTSLIFNVAGLYDVQWSPALVLSQYVIYRIF